MIVQNAAFPDYGGVAFFVSIYRKTIDTSCERAINCFKVHLQSLKCLMI